MSVGMQKDSKPQDHISHPGDAILGVDALVVAVALFAARLERLVLLALLGHPRQPWQCICIIGSGVSAESVSPAECHFKGRWQVLDTHRSALDSSLSAGIYSRVGGCWSSSFESDAKGFNHG